MSRQSKTATVERLDEIHPTLRAYVENQFVLGRKPEAISQNVATRYGVELTSAALASYRERCQRADRRAVREAFRRSKAEIEQLIEDMGSNSASLLGLMAESWLSTVQACIALRRLEQVPEARERLYPKLPATRSELGGAVGAGAARLTRGEQQ